jgi:hypothetical protein
VKKDDKEIDFVREELGLALQQLRDDLMTRLLLLLLVVQNPWMSTMAMLLLIVTTMMIRSRQWITIRFRICQRTTIQDIHKKMRHTF